MPGGYGTDESTPWGSSGTSYVTPGQTSSPYVSSAGPTNEPVNYEPQNNQVSNSWSGNDWANEFADTGITVDYATETSVAFHTDGQPLHTNMKLSFMETQIVTRERVENEGL